MTIRAVCFDLDDTLYEYREYAAAGLRSAAEVLETRTGESLHDELQALYFDAGVTEDTFGILLERHDLPADLIDELVDAYHDATTPLPPAPATEEVLGRLSDRYRLGLITDGRGGDEKLDRLGIRAYFDAVLVTHQIDRSKHDPAVFQRVLSELSVPPSAAVYVGDDPRVDFRAPNELHMTTIRIRRGRYADIDPVDDRHAPDHETETLQGVLKHL